MGKNNILLTIAARGGSKGVKNKNIRNLCGKPLIAHTILQAKRWGRANKIICSTDSPQIAAIAKKHGAQVPFLLPKELATSTAGKIEVLKHALKTVEKQTGQRFNILVDLDATAPLRKISDIEGAFRLFLKKRPKSVFSVAPSRRNPYFNMLEVNSKGYAVLVKKLKFLLRRRQDAPKVYDANASIYVYDRNYLLDDNTESSLSNRTLIWIMDEFSAFDIDSEADFQFVEFLVKKRLVSL